MVKRSVCKKINEHLDKNSGEKLKTFLAYFDDSLTFCEPLFKISAEVLTSNAGLIIYCAGLLLWALIAALIFNKRIQPINSELDNLCKEIKKSSDLEDFANNFFTFDEICSKSRYFQNSWKEFSEVLLMPKVDFEDGTYIGNSKQPGLFFSQRTILWPRIPMRFYNTLPNYLTGLGILGTFLGLVAGIHLAAPGLNSQNIQDAKNALEELLNGASLAFLSSIAGLLSSIAFSVFEKRNVYKFDRLLSCFVEGIEKRIKYISAKKLASLSLLESKKQTASLESFSNDLAISLGAVLDERVTKPMNQTLVELCEVLKGVREDQKRASDETLERLIQKFTEAISGAAGTEMKAFAETVQGLSGNLTALNAKMSENYAEMQDQSRKTIDQLGDSFREGSEELRKQMSASIAEMVDGVKRSVAAMTAMLQEATSESAENMRLVSQEFRSSIECLKQSVGDMSAISENTKSVLSGLENLLVAVKESQQGLVESIKPMSDVASDMKIASENIESIVSSLVQAGGNIENSISSLDEIQKEMANAWSAYDEKFDSIDKSLARAFSQIGQGVSTFAESMKGYVIDIDKHTSAITTQLAGATSELRESVEELSDVMEHRP